MKAQGYYSEYPLQDAAEKLRGLYETFPFKDKIPADVNGRWSFQSRSLAVQIAAMVAMFAASLVPKGSSRMGFVYNANAPRSGKTLLMKMAVMPIYGKMAIQTWKHNEDDVIKILDSEVFRAANYVAFDNVRGMIASQALEALMTTPVWTGRILGLSKMFQAENNLNLFITGNECKFSTDLTNRCLFCDLFVDEADVQQRGHKRIIDEPWLMNKEVRHQMLSCLWSLVLDWDKKGRPKSSDFGFKPMNGFESWCEVVGGIVANAGFGNCLERPELEHSGDQEGKEIRELVLELASYMNGGNVVDFEFQQIVNIAHENDMLDYLMHGRKDGVDYILNPESKSKFGLFLKRWAPENGRKFRLTADLELVFNCKGKGRSRRYVLTMANTKEGM